MLLAKCLNSGVWGSLDSENSFTKTSSSRTGPNQGGTQKAQVP